jgi:hypothetical protein
LSPRCGVNNRHTISRCVLHLVVFYISFITLSLFSTSTLSSRLFNAEAKEVGEDEEGAVFLRGAGGPSRSILGSSKDEAGVGAS